MDKTHIKAELILASKNAATGDILYSFRLTYPRIILAEFLTHRVFSRNTSSSRAIPGKKMRQQVLNDPFIPTYLGAKQKGMTAGDKLTGIKRFAVRTVWSAARYPAVLASWLMEKSGVAKQIANRVLEPWLWVVQVASATDLNNFLKLRTHKDAEPHFALLARQMAHIVWQTKIIFANMEERGLKRDRTDNAFQILQPGDWHLPFTDNYNFFSTNDLKAISAARCARTSYTVVGGSTGNTALKDVELGKKLIAANPLHASPLEHQAKARINSERLGNFRGWKQWRIELEGLNAGDQL